MWFTSQDLRPKVNCLRIDKQEYLSRYTECRSQNNLWLQFVCYTSTSYTGCIFWKSHLRSFGGQVYWKMVRCFIAKTK